MANVIPEDFLEWMDDDPEVTDDQRQRLQVLVAGSMHVRMFLIGLFDHGANWNIIAQATLRTHPSSHTPTQQATAMCPVFLEKEDEIAPLGNALVDMQDGGYRAFVKDILRGLKKAERDKLADYVVLS